MYASYWNSIPSQEESLEFVEISSSWAQNAEEEGSGRGGVPEPRISPYYRRVPAQAGWAPPSCCSQNWPRSPRNTGEKMATSPRSHHWQRSLVVWPGLIQTAELLFWDWGPGWANKDCCVSRVDRVDTKPQTHDARQSEWRKQWKYRWRHPGQHQRIMTGMGIKCGCMSPGNRR